MSLKTPYVSPSSYVGRFAPSPTGPLHLGSLLSALGSYLDAKHQGGTWIIRIEDLDPPREIDGAAEGHIEALKKFGLISDTPIVKQSERHAIYAEHLQQLDRQGLTYHCSCTRKALMPYQGIHPFNHCPSADSPPQRQQDGTTSLRLKTPQQLIEVLDQLQPPFSVDIQKISGDFILKRKDGLYAYHLAVTVDDHLQSITHIVRGADLLDTTPQQMYLQKLLKFKTPHYLHLPVITHNDGSKLSKQTFAKSIEQAPTVPTLLALLGALGQKPPSDLKSKTVSETLRWATQHWSRENIPTQTTLFSEEIEHNIAKIKLNAP